MMTKTKTSQLRIFPIVNQKIRVKRECFICHRDALIASSLLITGIIHRQYGGQVSLIASSLFITGIIHRHYGGQVSEV